MYKAVVVNSLSNDLSSTEILDIERKKLESNEIRIQVKAASVNFPDLLMTEGLYQYKPKTPFILGMESSGVIIEKGNTVSTFSIGDEVIVSGRPVLLLKKLLLLRI